MMAQGDAGGRVTLVGIALVIHGAIAADDRNERKSNSQPDLDDPQHRALGAHFIRDQMKGS